MFFSTLQGRENYFLTLTKSEQSTLHFFLPWGKKNVDNFSDLDENVFEMEGELLLETKNDVWRRLRRAVRKNKRKTRLNRVIFQQISGLKFFPYLEPKPLKKH